MSAMMFVRMAPMAKIGKVEAKKIEKQTICTDADLYSVALDTPPAHDELDTAE